MNLLIVSDNNSNYNGNIQIIKDIEVKDNSEFQNDNKGPLLFLYQNNTTINDGSIVNKNLPVKIILDDPQGINFMDAFQHNVRYWFNDSAFFYNLNSNLFEYDEASCGKTIANFFLPDNLKSGSNSIHVEAWDNGNNRTLFSCNLNIENNVESYVNNLYNFPNPFSDLTFFTFYLSKYPADIEINIYILSMVKE